MNAEVTINTSPYLMGEPPTSPGRALLARAYEHYCALQWGYTGEEIAAAFSGEGDERRIAEDLRWSTRLLGELLAQGEIRSWGRPIGGGEPVALKSSLWELDDFRSRFEQSALCLATPFDAAPPSHWIFVALDDWNRVVEASLGMTSADATEPTVRLPTPKPVAQPPLRGSAPGKGQPSPTADTDRLIRLPEVMDRTSLSKPTIYRRMASGRFPRNLLLPGNISVWHETEISDWIADPLQPAAD